MNIKKNLVIFSGSGISKESGINTFRDNDENSIWNKYNIEEVATINAWTKNKEKVLEFYNLRRKELQNIQPNNAHIKIKELENYFNVNVITQNVDDLHEKAGSTDVLHIHGELNKAQSTFDKNLIYDWKEDIILDHKCENGSQLRPYITWFGERLDIEKLNKAKEITDNADVFVIIGTSLIVEPAASLYFFTNDNCLLYYIDPGNFNFHLTKKQKKMFKHIKEPATKGMEILYNELVK